MADFFGCRLQFVDQALINIQKTHGYLDWMKGRSKINHLPGYDETTTGNRNFLILTRRDADWKMIFWLCDNGVEGWSHEAVLDGITFTHYFYFRDAGDWALARLSA